MADKKNIEKWKRDERNKKRREAYKNMDPEKKKALKAKKLIAYQKKKEVRREFWSTGTEDALEDKTNFLNKKREINKKSKLKKTLESNGARETNNTLKSVMAQPIASPMQKRRKDMTEEEQRVHDNQVRHKRYANLSHQVRSEHF